MYRLLVSFLFLIATFSQAIAISIYRDSFTGFSDISDYNCQSNNIVIDNNNSICIFDTHLYATDVNEFSFEARFRDGSDLTTKNRFLLSEISTAQFGIVWNFCDIDNYTALIFQRKNDEFYNELDSSVQNISAKIVSVCDGVSTIISTIKKCNEYLSPSNFYNSVKIECKHGETSISVGHHELKKIWKGVINNISQCNIGFLVDTNAHLEVKRVEFNCPDTNPLNFTFPIERIEEATKTSQYNPIIGYWDYLDRNTDDDLFAFGGKYSLAIIQQSDNNYAIVYIDGAKLYPELWHPGKTKGMLSGTPFINTYNLIWLDSRLSLIDEEMYATIDGNILTLNFPIRKSIVRFVKRSN